MVVFSRLEGELLVVSHFEARLSGMVNVSLPERKQRTKADPNHISIGRVLETGEFQEVIQFRYPKNLSKSDIISFVEKLLEPLSNFRNTPYILEPLKSDLLSFYNLGKSERRTFAG